jgi:hypothetical protein
MGSWGTRRTILLSSAVVITVMFLLSLSLITSTGDGNASVGNASKEENHSQENCTNGLDDDFDGLVDHGDTDCPLPECLTDYECAPLDCPGADGTLAGACIGGVCRYTEPASGCITNCSDSVDNDCDGRADVAGSAERSADPGCANASSMSEFDTCASDTDCSGVCPDSFLFSGRCITGVCEYCSRRGVLCGCHPYYKEYDYNGDGRLDASDIAILKNALGGSPCPAGKTCDIDEHQGNDANDLVFLKRVVEKSANGGEDCADGIDNNCDGLLDAADFFCSVANCSNPWRRVCALPVTCDGGAITFDDCESLPDGTTNDCRNIICAGNGRVLQVMACEKPDEIHPQYFELYKTSQEETDKVPDETARLKVCLHETCIQENGFARGPDFPICPACADTCSGLGFTCGEHAICGVNVTCGSCSGNQTCNPQGACVANCTDSDHDGFSPDGAGCGPVDCNDSNPSIHPGAIENCSNGVDDDCDGLIDAADPACRPQPICGDGIVQESEQCDKGAANGRCPASCSAACRRNSCGGGGGGGTSHRTSGGGGGSCLSPWFYDPISRQCVQNQTITSSANATVNFTILEMPIPICTAANCDALVYPRTISVPILSIIRYRVTVRNNEARTLEHAALALDVPATWEYGGPINLGTMAPQETRVLTIPILVSEALDPTQHIALRFSDDKGSIANGTFVVNIVIPDFAVRVKPSLDGYRNETEAEVYVLVNNRVGEAARDLEVELDVNRDSHTDYVQYLGVFDVEPSSVFRYRYTYPVARVNDASVVVTGVLREHGSDKATSDDTAATVYHPTAFDKDARDIDHVRTYD